jgi:integrase
MDVEKFDRLLERANQRLRNANIKISIERHNHRLYLRGIFPPKPGSGKLTPWQQRLSIAQANREGLEIAEARAKTIGGQLDLGVFDWSPYLDISTEAGKVETIGELVEKFEREYFATRQRNGATETTWKGDYQRPFDRLPGDRPIDPDILQEILLTTRPDSRQRRRFAMAYSKLADFTGLNHNLRKFIGSYSSTRSISPRDLPNDRDILMAYDSFPSLQWRWAFAMMACYGLRNHEIFFTDLEDYPIAYVFRGKSTDERYVWPLYPEWADRWEVQNFYPPNCTGKSHGDLGNRVTHAFKRAGVFSPYNLRHAWAVRAILFDLDIAIAAAMMGHSVAVHTQIYLKWITKDTHQRAMDIILGRSDRPLPP